jgi:hypothetical protein
MTLDGDLVLNHGDLDLTDGFDWVSREVNKRIRTINPSWVAHPIIGASLDYYIGLPNTESNSRRIRQSIERSLSIGDIGFPGQWVIDVFPIGADTIAIIINLSIAGISVMLERAIYNYSNGVTQPVDEDNWIYNTLPADVKTVDVSHKSGSANPNKYQQIIDNRSSGD